MDNQKKTQKNIGLFFDWMVIILTFGVGFNVFQVFGININSSVSIIGVMMGFIYFGLSYQFNLIKSEIKNKEL